MVCIEVINNDRIKYGYISHQFKAYKNHCNKMKKIHKKDNQDLYLSYSLEANMAKFKMLNALPYLYKNLRLLRKFKKSDNKTYQEYIECFISSKKNEIEIDKIVDLRNKLSDFYSFLDDIYILNDNRHDFEQYKTKHTWNGITIVFETAKIRDSFVDGSFSFCDFRFNTQLAVKILEVERNMKSLKAKLKSSKIAIEAYECIKVLHTAVCNIERFLSDNFVESEYILELKDSCDQVLAFVKSILNYQNGDLSSQLSSFVVPKLFNEISAELHEMNKEKKIDSQKLALILRETLEKRLKVDDRVRKMPLLPVFYDIAYDFIEYPKTDESVVGILQRFDFFNKK